MYAVIKTGGKQYTVRPGDLLVVEKLDGQPGADITFGEVLMLGDGDNVTVGGPTVAGASVAGTLIETRKGDKIKVFKKIRRQGYRRTQGHRQLESVIRVTAIGAEGKTDKWDGTVDLTPKALLNARARGLKGLVQQLEGESLMTASEAAAQAPAAPAKKAKAKPAQAELTAEEASVEAAVEVPAAVEAEAPAPKAKKAAAPKAEKAEGEKAPAKKAAPKAKKTEE